MAEEFDVSLGLEDTHVLVTGAAGHIGFVVIKAFLAAGAIVSAFDINQSKMTLQHARLFWQVVDVSSEQQMEEAFSKACATYGVIAGTWLRGIRDHVKSDIRNVQLTIIGSESGTFGVTGNADYAASKAAIQYGLVRSMVKDVVSIYPRARINAIAPGPVDTPQFRKECEDNKLTRWLDSEATVALKTAVPMQAVARMCLFLASERWSGNVTGQVLNVDSGKSGKIHWLPGQLIS